jgi:GNAT superfamily N-acetyltransferase
MVDAGEQSLAEINELIARSKAHWSWPQGYLEMALPLHTITPEYLRSNHCFEVLDAHNKLIAFVSIVVGSARVVLDNLWVTPELIGNGIGRRTCGRVFQLAREQGWTELWVLPDPQAEGFYVKMGFSDIGEQVPSRVSGGPIFSVYRIQLSEPESS